METGFSKSILLYYLRVANLPQRQTGPLTYMSTWVGGLFWALTHILLVIDTIWHLG